MPTAAASFDVKCLGLNASQDAGSLTKGGKVYGCNLQYITSSSLGVDFDVNDIVTYGQAAFRTGECCGYMLLLFNGNEYHIGLHSFDEIKTSGRAYYRFNFPYLSFKSSSFVPNG